MAEVVVEAEEAEVAEVVEVPEGAEEVAEEATPGTSRITEGSKMKKRERNFVFQILVFIRTNCTEV